jgi:GNAT superfamily N-acetyltransferase
LESRSAYQVNVVDPADAEAARRCFRVFAVLRPHLDEKEFVARLKLQAKEGYTIACIEVDGEVRAAAGYRLANFLAWGKVLYIDDLITDPMRKQQGMGGALMDWLLEKAKEERCDEVHLDTGFQRHDAHRLYLNKGLVLSCHHMSAKIV